MQGTFEVFNKTFNLLDEFKLECEEKEFLAVLDAQ